MELLRNSLCTAAFSHRATFLVGQPITIALVHQGHAACGIASSGKHPFGGGIQHRPVVVVVAVAVAAAAVMLDR